MHIKKFNIFLNEKKSMDNLYGYKKVIIIENCSIYLKIYINGEDHDYDEFDEYDLNLSKGDIIYIDILDDMGNEVYVAIELKEYDNVGTGLLNKDLFEVDIEQYNNWEKNDWGVDYITFRNNINKYNL